MIPMLFSLPIPPTTTVDVREPTHEVETTIQAEDTPGESGPGQGLLGKDRAKRGREGGGAGGDC